MARLNDDAQWIILMGFLISFSFFFLAIIINQSTVVGQTTAESVIEFPKNDIRDLRGIIEQSANMPSPDSVTVHKDITVLSLNRKNAIVEYSFTNSSPSNPHTTATIHYNNGVTIFYENWTSL
jgi:hypothetical protein